MERSKKAFAEAQKFIPGGVNSPVRAFKAVGGNPVFIERGSGSKIYDIDGNEYIDYVLSWGPMIVGHAHPDVTSALKKAVDRGTSFGAPTEAEVILARMINKIYPSMEMVRLVSSGTEATMSAIRLARGYTWRDKIVKFEGCYHGHADSLLVKAGSGAATFGLPDSPGVPADLAKMTITLAFNDLKAVKKAVERESNEIACIIVEPVPGNMGLILPEDGFLQGLRELCTRHGIILIFDEVMSGFRVAYGGAQGLYNIKPDMTCLGKVIGGGLPVGAFGGKRDIMEKVAPVGPVYQAGTLSGNPLAVAAGIETLKILDTTGTYESITKKTKELDEGLKDAARRAGVSVYTTSIGSELCIFFSAGTVFDYASAKKSDTNAFGKFFMAMLKQGIYLPPSQFETLFLSTMHSDEDINKTIEAARRAFREV